MGDAPFIGWLSVVPLLVILALIAAVAVAWRSGRRSVRTGAAILLVVIGIAAIFTGAGLFFSLAGGAVLVVVGLALIIAEYRRGSPH